MTGAAFGYAPLWTALFSFPLMAAVQLMCARLGMVTGRGLAGVVRRRYPRWVLWGACLLLIVANIVNIGADLGGMAEATADGDRHPCAGFWTPFYTRVDRRAALLDVLPHDGAHLQVADAGAVRLRRRGVPRPARLGRMCCAPRSCRTFSGRARILSVLVGILGTTISPYLFFWQAAQEVEEERAMGSDTVAAAQRRDRRGTAPRRAPT